MAFLFDAVLVVAGLLQSLTTVYRGVLLYVRETVDDLEAYSEEHGVSVEAILRSSRVGFAIQFVFTVFYWLAVYELVFRR